MDTSYTHDGAGIEGLCKYWEQNGDANEDEWSSFRRRLPLLQAAADTTHGKRSDIPIKLIVFIILDIVSLYLERWSLQIFRAQRILLIDFSGKYDPPKHAPSKYASNEKLQVRSSVFSEVNPRLQLRKNLSEVACDNHQNAFQETCRMDDHWTSICGWLTVVKRNFSSLAKIGSCHSTSGPLVR